MSALELQLQKVVAAACGGATVLTPNKRAARYVLSACNKKHAAGRGTWLTPDVLTVAAWMERFWKVAQVSGHTSLVLLTDVQRADIWRQIVADSTSRGELLQPSSLAGSAVDAWQLMQAYRIPVNASGFAATRQSRDFHNWCTDYARRCNRESLIDTATLPDAIATLAPSVAHLLPKHLLLWGFEDFTPQQQALLQTLAEAGIRVEEITLAHAPIRRASRIVFDDLESELRYAAGWARAQLRESPESTIAIVVPQLDACRSTAEQLLAEVLQPEFFAGVDHSPAFDLAAGLPLASWPMVCTAVLWLRLATGSLPFAELRELLTSPFFAGSSDERSSRAQLAAKLGKVAPEQVSLARLLALLDHKEVRAIECPRLRGVLRTFAAALQRWPSRAIMSDWADRITKLLNELGWPPAEERILDSAEFQVCRRWSELLSVLAGLDVTRGPVDLDSAVRQILLAAESTEFAPENTGAPVQLVDVEEVRGCSFDAIWMCGMTDDAWPPRRRGNPYLPIALQRDAGVPWSTPEGQLQLARTTINRIATSATEIIFSSSRNEEDRELRTTSLIAGAEPVSREAITAEFPATWHELQLGASIEELTDVTAPASDPNDIVRRGTKLLELQAQCPFRAFAELRLSAERSDEPVPGFKGVDRGRVVERVLELVWEQLKDRNTLDNPSEPIETIVRNAVEAAMQERIPSYDDDPANQRLRLIESARLIPLVQEWLDLEKRRALFRVWKQQFEVNLELAGLRLKGYVDRIDMIDSEGIVILDYKAGSPDFHRMSKWKTPRPLLPQLPFYAVALQAMGHEVAGLGFAVVARGECEMKGASVRKEILGHDREKLNSLTGGRSMNEQIVDWRVELSRLTANHLAGDAAPDPKIAYGRSGSPCESCHLQALCRIAENAAVVDGCEEGSDE